MSETDDVERDDDVESPPVRRKRGVRVGGAGRRRLTGLDEPLSRTELKEAALDEKAKKARRRITYAIAVAFLLVWSVVVFTWWVGQRPATEETQPPEVVVPAEGVSALFVVVDDGGHAVSLALVAASDDAGDRLTLMHPSLLVTLPGFGENLLSNATRFDGAKLAGTTVTNLLGVRIDEVVVWTADTLAGLVSEPVVVDLPVPLIVEDGDAQVVIAGAGSAGRDGASLARLLTDKGLGDDLDLLQRQGAVWRALLAESAVNDRFVDELMADSGRLARDAFVGLATGDAVFTIVPATRIEPSGNEERYQLDGVDAASFVETHLAFLQLAPEPRVRVEVLNGNGLIGTTQPVAALLVEAGFRVVLTDNADRSDYETTLLIAQTLTNQNAAVAARDLLGIGDVSVEVRQPSGVVDLTIIVGQDLPATGGE